MTVRAIRRMVPEPSARANENFAAVRLYSTRGRHVLATAKQRPRGVRAPGAVIPEDPRNEQKHT